ncbi:MAG: hypothetical protein WCH62_04210 [Candidatus Omnitrophota bacterium]
MKKSIPENLKVFSIIAAMVISSRIVIFLLAYCGLLFYRNQSPGFFPSLQNLWDRWDSNHYLYIAQHGYTSVPDKSPLIVFAPLFPSLIQLLHYIISNVFLCSLIVSNTFLIIAAITLYKLAAMDYDKNTALRCVKYLLIYPFSFFLNISFSESTFLAFFLLSVYAMRRKLWVIASLVAFLTVLARPNSGIFLLIILIVECFLEKPRSKDLLQKATVAVSVVVGYSCYLLLNKIVLGDWVAFLKFEKINWYHHYIFFISNIQSMFNQLRIKEPSYRITLLFPQIVTFFTVGLLSIIGLWRIRLSYSLYLISFLLATYSISWLISGERYLATAFPLFLILGIISRHAWLDFILTFISTILLAFYVLSFTYGSVTM